MSASTEAIITFMIPADNETDEPSHTVVYRVEFEGGFEFDKDSEGLLFDNLVSWERLTADEAQNRQQGAHRAAAQRNTVRGGHIDNTVTGNVTGSLMQVGDIRGGLNL